MIDPAKKATEVLEVKLHQMMPIDFSRTGSASAYGIEDSIAVATVHSRTGTLSHLMMRDSLEIYMRFLGLNAPKDSHIYLVGGWEKNREDRAGTTQPDSDIYLKWLRRFLVEHGYSIKAESGLFAPGHGCDLIMRHRQPIELQQYMLIRRPGGYEKMPLGCTFLQV